MSIDTTERDNEIWASMSNEDKAIYNNAINLAKHHRENCHDPNCGVSLMILHKLLEKAGLPVFESDIKYFL